MTLAVNELVMSSFIRRTKKQKYYSDYQQKINVIIILSAKIHVPNENNELLRTRLKGRR